MVRHTLCYTYVSLRLVKSPYGCKARFPVSQSCVYGLGAGARPPPLQRNLLLRLCRLLLLLEVALARAVALVSA